MKLSKLIRVLQEHLKQAGDMEVALHHDRPYSVEAINSVCVGNTETQTACLICTELGNSVVEANVAGSKARNEIERVKNGA